VAISENVYLENPEFLTLLSSSRAKENEKSVEMFSTAPKISILKI
jgi:hypothetical protein